MTPPIRQGIEGILKHFALEVISKAGVLDSEVEASLFKAFRSVPRHWFCGEQFIEEAYADHALPSEYGQLLSKPSVVARMLSLVPRRVGGRVLEVGSGSGYSSALLSSMGYYVYGVEEIGLLCQKSRKRLDSHGVPNVLLKPGDGFEGWSEHSPYLAVLVWTPCSVIEDRLFEQISPDGGVLIAPVGDNNQQTLHLWTKEGEETKHVRFERVSLLEGA